MSISKRDFLAIGAAAGASMALPAWAQAKPLFDTLNMFVPAAPGGGWDGTARAIERAAKAAGLVGNMQFENVGGAGGMVGLPRYVNQRKGQGNSLMVGGSVMVGAGIANKSPVTMRNVTPIARLTEEAGVIAVPTNGKIKTWKDLEAAIKANPKAVSVAGGSAGGTDHILLGMIIQALGRNPREAAYVAFAGGGPANAAILGGQVTAGISGYSEFEEQIKAGRMVALAVSGNRRIPGVNVPTLTELGVNVTAANWRGVFAAPGISQAQRDKLIDFISKVHASDAWKKELETRKWTDVFMTERPFEREIEANIKATEVIMKDLGLA
ncbi:MAG: tripartite tricarboxylate transporter substrate-binding protein [Limnohabitans sp.]|jgi:putative tricarboxylic transport membrane protein|nr:tripartite tricarboxylate transporter substrate-binding protein [Limnohabitans sp.]MDP4734255.1 tripartite tricarboxylate transporter substrate-binding protein [Limnohabitans sp.]MDP4772808.1 tripartite tricarboxylate transporter substrate-binding protein [Limnohabitans sp.]MDP4923619.1 tripartite tricarboxylate transporter substrate-binding protein [Limnohabitans sp.]